MKKQKKTIPKPSIDTIDQEQGIVTAHTTAADGTVISVLIDNRPIVATAHNGMVWFRAGHPLRKNFSIRFV
jgi:hypothetical protein